MIKFSIIVPVYNVEEYIADCLDSILKQSYDNYEVIVVNDGSPDNSQDIIDKYVKKDKRIKSYIKKNGGLSDARNFGVKKAKGDYLVFLDSDDTINDRLLEELNKVDNNVDIIRYQVNKIDKDNSYVNKSEVFDLKNGEEAFISLINNDWFVSACSSAYRREYFVKNKYEYPLGKLHEDFGVTPFIYINAKKVTSIDYVGYNYYFRDNSIMNSNNMDKIKRKNNDCLYHFDRLKEMIDKSKVSDRGRKYYMSFISYTLINRINIIRDKDMLDEYLGELKKRKVDSYLIDDTIPRKLKKLLFKVSPKVYIKLFVK